MTHQSPKQLFVSKIIALLESSDVVDRAQILHQELDRLDEDQWNPADEPPPEGSLVDILCIPYMIPAGNLERWTDLVFEKGSFRQPSIISGEPTNITIPARVIGWRYVPELAYPFTLWPTLSSEELDAIQAQGPGPAVIMELDPANSPLPATSIHLLHPTDGWIDASTPPLEGAMVDVWCSPTAFDDPTQCDRWANVMWQAGEWRQPSTSSVWGHLGEILPAKVSHWRHKPTAPQIYVSQSQPASEFAADRASLADTEGYGSTVPNPDALSPGNITTITEFASIDPVQDAINTIRTQAHRDYSAEQAASLQSLADAMEAVISGDLAYVTYSTTSGVVVSVSPDDSNFNLKTLIERERAQGQPSTQPSLGYSLFKDKE